MTYKEQFETARKAGKVHSVSPQWTKFEREGDSVCGIYVSASEVPSGLGTGTYLQYLMQTDEGPIKFSMGAATDREMKALLAAGELYRITYAGQQKIKGGKRVNRFTVEALTVGPAEEITSDDVPF